VSVTAAPVARSVQQRLDRRRVYIFATASGVTFGAMLLVILLGAINYDNALGYLLAFLMFGLVMVGMLHTYRNLTGLIYRGARAQPVFAGEDALFECQFDNTSRLPRVRLALGPWPQGLDRAARRFMQRYEVVVDMPATSQLSVPVRRLSTKRGWLHLDRLRVQSVYPLGILRAWAYFDGAAQCLVYPAPRGTLPLPLTRSTASGNGEIHGSGSDEFAGLRPYAAGDPVRAIAWKSLAQEREVMVKRFHGQGAARMVLSWSTVASLAGVEARLSQLCQWVLQAHQAGHNYALELPGVYRAFGQGREHRDECLRALALFETRA
jgi:uncharacterized protein (DUF58 family)